MNTLQEDNTTPLQVQEGLTVIQKSLLMRIRTQSFGSIFKPPSDMKFQTVSPLFRFIFPSDMTSAPVAPALQNTAKREMKLRQSLKHHGVFLINDKT